MVSILLICLGLVADDGTKPPARPAPDRDAYEAARKAAGSDAQAQVRLALWCEQHGLTAERMKHLAAAVTVDPSNGLARGLMGLVARGAKWERPEEVSREARDDPRQKALLEEYLQRRAKAPDKADDQWRLAQWCEQNGLKEQAVAHYHAVLRLDPRRDAVWKHLGFKKVNGGWIKPEWQEAAKREAGEQARANKHWKSLLEKWSAGLSSRVKARRTEAEAGLASVTDPRAVPMIWAVFIARGAAGQRVALQVLRQIDAPGSTRAIALMALRSPAGDVRRDAIAILRDRDPRDYGGLLVTLLRDRIKFEVRRVNGPGSRGELLIKGPDVNVDRLYSPPPLPFIPIQVGDSLSYDAAGLPVLNRSLGSSTQFLPVPGNSLAAAQAAVAQRQSQTPTTFSNIGLPPNVAAQLNALRAQPALPVTVTQSSQAIYDRSTPSLLALNPKNYKVTHSTTATATESFSSTEQIPIGQLMLQYQEAALVAEQQLEADVRVLQAYNVEVQLSNQSILQVLSSATGLDLGEDRTAWVKWMADLLGYAPTLTTSSPTTPTVVEQVPLAYQPQGVPVTTFTQPTGFQVSVDHITSVHCALYPDCFGAGTPVRTLEGSRPIESLRPGDLVLTQDPRSGVLRYQAVVAIYHNPPQPTERVTTESGEAFAVTRIHWLWKAGKGWVMARELKPGDALRTLGGLATVRSIESDRTQPVYNLRVAEGESYFVGKSGVLAHDNSTINPVPEPFDAVAPPADVAPSTAPRPRSMLGR
jgi:tetratricopeptide (TPR) repeat protein